MIDLTIIILVFNEEAHIGRAISNALKLTNKIVVVDSDSTDKTAEIAESLGTRVYQYKWTKDSTWSKKMNWSIANVDISTNWFMRLDADEYMTENFIFKIKNLFSNIDNEISAISVNRREYFMGRWMKHGGVYPKSMIRIIKKGKAVYENRLLDEHVEVNEGVILNLNIDICDDRNISLTEWTLKHNGYSELEAMMLLDKELNIIQTKDNSSKLDEYTTNKRKKKDLYSKFPLFWRVWFLFIYRFFFKMAFLDGKEGFLYSFLQCLWYRTLADAKIWELKRKFGGDKEKMVVFLRKKYGVS